MEKTNQGMNVLDNKTAGIAFKRVALAMQLSRIHK